MLIYNPSEKISKYFTMGEVGKSEIASRKNIPNVPTSPILENAQILAVNVLDVIREHYGRPFSPTSWYRSEALEKEINSTAWKQWAVRKGMPVNQATWKAYFALKSHPQGQAADIEVPGVSNDELYNWVKQNLQYDQLIREFPKAGDPFSGWVHVSFRASGNRQQDFTIEG